MVEIHTDRGKIQVTICTRGFSFDIVYKGQKSCTTLSVVITNIRFMLLTKMLPLSGC